MVSDERAVKHLNPTLGASRTASAAYQNVAHLEPTFTPTALMKQLLGLTLLTFKTQVEGSTSPMPRTILFTG